MVKVMKNRLKNRFDNRIKRRSICNGKSFITENYRASDFKLSCGITLAKFEKIKNTNHRDKNYSFLDRIIL